MIKEGGPVWVVIEPLCPDASEPLVIKVAREGGREGFGIWVNLTEALDVWGPELITWLRGTGGTWGGEGILFDGLELVWGFFFG